MDYPLDHTIDDTQAIHIKRIAPGSLFKLVAVSVFSVFVPLFVFFGILALFGFKTVRVNYQTVVGLNGLIAAVIMAPMFSAAASVIGWIVLYVGISICGFFKPLTIRYVSAEKPKA